MDKELKRRLIRHIEQAIGYYQRQLLSFNDDNLSKDNWLYSQTLDAIADAQSIITQLKGDNA